MPYFKHKHPDLPAPRERKSPFFQKGDKNENAFFSPAPQHSLQPKLTIGRPGDKYEQEADAMANAVVNQNAGQQVQQKEQEVSQLQRQEMEEEEGVQAKLNVQRQAAPEEEEVQAKLQVQRQAAPEEEEVQAKPELQKQEEEEEVQAKSNNSAAGSSLSGKLQSSRGSGQALPKKTQTEMSAAFGHDFSDVNIHTNSESAQMNQDLNAQAFTHGKDIYFNQGKYNPESTSGKHLLAHELTHVVQQDPEKN